MVSSQTISVGQLSSFLLYAAYIGVSIGGLSSFYSELNKSIGAGSRIWEIMDRQSTIPVKGKIFTKNKIFQTSVCSFKGGITPLELPRGKIVFQNVAFTYPSRKDIQIFNDLNLEIEPGKMVAVVGPSGSGKSTLAALLLRLYDPSKGSIFIDDYEIKQLDPVWIKKFIGTVAQVNS